jgi:hypothetical protein
MSIHHVVIFHAPVPFPVVRARTTRFGSSLKYQQLRASIRQSLQQSHCRHHCLMEDHYYQS